MNRPSFTHRRPAKTPQQIRQDWVSAVENGGKAACDAIAAGEGVTPPASLGPGQTFTAFAAAIRDLTPENYPLGANSSRTMAGAFLALARMFTHPATPPQARTSCAPFLLAGARSLDAQITALRSEEAARSWGRQTGERDE